MEELKEQLQKSIREVPKFDKLQNHIDMTVTNEGLRIELTESATGTFFDSGSARISVDGKRPAEDAGAGNLASFPITSRWRGTRIREVPCRNDVWQLGTVRGSGKTRRGGLCR